MEQTPEQVVEHLVNLLNSRLSTSEDAETAIWTYKTANWIISEMEEVKHNAINLAEQDLHLQGKQSLKTSAGSAGWTEPKARQLDEAAWSEALARDSELLRLQREYDQAQARLEQAQEKYMRLPEPNFFIR